MIRDNIQKGTKVFNEDCGFGIFKGWFQDSVDIANVEWSDKNRTVQHKRYLTEVDDKEDLSGPIGCLINKKREFEDEMDKIISEQSTESIERLEALVGNYNIAIDILRGSKY